MPRKKATPEDQKLLEESEQQAKKDAETARQRTRAEQARQRMFQRAAKGIDVKPAKLSPEDLEDRLSNLADHTPQHVATVRRHLLALDTGRADAVVPENEIAEAVTRLRSFVIADANDVYGHILALEKDVLGKASCPPSPPPPKPAPEPQPANAR